MSRLDTIMGLRLSKAFQYSGKEGSIRNCFSGTLASNGTHSGISSQYPIVKKYSLAHRRGSCHNLRYMSQVLGSVRGTPQWGPI